MGRELPRTVTPVGTTETRELLRVAAPDLTEKQRDWFVALILIESGNGNLICYNFGNLANGGFVDGAEKLWTDSDYWRPGWFSDESDPLHARMLEGTAPSCFRAFVNAELGMASFAKLIMSAQMTSLRAAAAADSPEAFVVALRASGYSPDYSEKHVNSFRSIVAKLRGGETRPSDPATGGKNDDGAWFVVGLSLALLTAGAIGVALARGHGYR